MKHQALKVTSNLKLFLAIFTLSCLLGLAFYFGLKELLGLLPFQQPFVRVFPYPNSQPIPYIVAIAFAFATISSFWLERIAPKKFRHPLLQIAFVPFVALLLAGTLCGMIWVYHDMQAGYFPDSPVFQQHIWWGAKTGLGLSIFAAIASFPLNILSYIVAYLIVFTIWKRKSVEL